MGSTDDHRLPASTDLLIVGAGPAGAVAATVGARAGLAVCLVDAASFPRDKACGEGIMPGGVELLERFGLGDALLDADARAFDAIRFHFAGKPSIVLPMDGGIGRRGRAVARVRLDAALLDRAKQAGATVVTGARLEDLVPTGDHVTALFTEGDKPREMRARFVVVATGQPSRRSSLARRFGLTGHIPDDGPPDRVDVFVRPGLEVYSSSVGADERVVALLVDARRAHVLPSHPRQRFADLLADPTLPAWLRIPPTRILGAPIHADPLLRPLPYHDATGRILRAGNALVPTDPVAAQGMTIALRSGGEAAGFIARGIAAEEGPLAVARRYRAAVAPWINRSRLIARSLREAVEIPSFGYWILGRIAAQGASSALVNDAAAASLPGSPARTLGAVALTALSLRRPATGTRLP